MNLRLRVFLPALLSALSCAASFAQAQTRVGEAVVVQNEVVRVAATTTQSIVGDSMLRDETVRTGADSAARFVMADSTISRWGRAPRSSSIAPSSTTSTAIEMSRSAWPPAHSVS